MPWACTTTSSSSAGIRSRSLSSSRPCPKSVASSSQVTSCSRAQRWKQSLLAWGGTSLQAIGSSCASTTVRGRRSSAFPAVGRYASAAQAPRPAPRRHSRLRVPRIVAWIDVRSPTRRSRPSRRRNVSAMLSLDPSGPYRILGYSFGGTVALTMARQLVASGREVEVLALLEPPVGRVDTSRLELTRAYAGRVHTRAAAVAPGHDTRARAARAAALARAGFRSMKRQVRVSSAGLIARRGIAQHDVFTEHQIRMLRAHRPRPYQGRTIVFGSPEYLERFGPALDALLVPEAAGGQRRDVAVPGRQRPHPGAQRRRSRPGSRRGARQRPRLSLVRVAASWRVSTAHLNARSAVPVASAQRGEPRRRTRQVTTTQDAPEANDVADSVDTPEPADHGDTRVTTTGLNAPSGLRRAGWFAHGQLIRRARVCGHDAPSLHGSARNSFGLSDGQSSRRQLESRLPQHSPPLRSTRTIGVRRRSSLRSQPHSSSSGHATITALGPTMRRERSRVAPRPAGFRSDLKAG